VIGVLLTFDGFEKPQNNEKSFRASGPRLRNKLPNQIVPSKELFCRLLKTNLFKSAYL